MGNTVFLQNLMSIKPAKNSFFRGPNSARQFSRQMHTELAISFYARVFHVTMILSFFRKGKNLSTIRCHGKRANYSALAATPFLN